MPIKKEKKFKSDNKSDKMKYLDKMKYDCHKLNKVFLDILKFAIDNDLVNFLYTLLMLRKFPEKVGKFCIDLNDIIETENDEMTKKQTNALCDQIVRIGGIFEETQLDLSYFEIKKKYKQCTKLVDANETMTDGEKINHLINLVIYDLDFQHDLD